ncbi:YcjX family GTP-binding protein [Algicola sagamiensis]|uniref:YcjX family protein n=1 Tax=Algicola sagamiensis TaxID=163869 RepID=UPI00037A7900|nr:YcjX family protein [Algicola sagamiensis]
MKDKFKSTLKKAGEKANKLAQTAAERRLRVAVTGLSQSGKTAFITSLVHHLTSEGSAQHFPFFDVMLEGRWLGGKIAPQYELNVPPFPYKPALQSVFSDPPQWPESTKGITQVSLEIRFLTEHPIKKSLGAYSTIYLDLIDYPGEWLLDLCMLRLSFKEWCQLISNTMHGQKKEFAAEFISALDLLDIHAGHDPDEIKQLSDLYKGWMVKARSAQLGYLFLPGRFLLPGDLDGAPMLDFFPVLDWHTLPDVIEGERHSTLQELNTRFEAYKKHVVMPFYETWFKRIDRQVVLVDCLSALNQGHESMNEMLESVELILKNFSYGQTSWLARIVKPRISKILVAATKADHVTPEQHENLVSLIQDMTSLSRKNAKFEGIEENAIALSSIRATEHGEVEDSGALYSCIQGTTPDGNRKTLFPGDVPNYFPTPHIWHTHNFDFPTFLPPKLPVASELPHIRMDQALQFLIGDKLV